MTTATYSYDRELFSRNYLNCAQRHSVVMLKERGVAVEHLFYNSLVSTDQTLDQMVRCGTPKYDFEGQCLSTDDLQSLGVTRTEVPGDTFDIVKSELLSSIRRDGFVLLAGDVFYFPHCPEYRVKHLFHLVILRGYDDKSDVWDIIDDNPASVLCEYQYTGEQVAAFYNNNSVREYRSFQQVGLSEDSIHEIFDHKSVEFCANYTDSYQLLTDVQDIIDNPWINQKKILGQLHDAFSILFGSRVCFAAYMDFVLNDVIGQSLAKDAATAAGRIRDSLVRAHITGRLNSTRLQERCMALQDLDARLLERVQSLQQITN